MPSERLFVYGSLKPGGSNAHVLDDVPGEWLPASVRGHLADRGWGAGLGYPGITLDDDGPDVAGFVLVSDALDAHWDRLDAFEGNESRRVTSTVTLADGQIVEAEVYVLANP